MSEFDTLTEYESSRIITDRNNENNIKLEIFMDSK